MTLAKILLDKRSSAVTAVAFVLATVGMLSCGDSSTPAPATPTTPTAPAFTVSVSSDKNVAFFSTFGSTVTGTNTATLNAQRTPAGSLTGGWNSTPSIVTLAQTGTQAIATAVASGDATITYADNSGPSGSAVVRSAPKFDSTITITGNTNTNSADCLDTTPPGTTEICSNATDIGLGQRTYSFTIASSAAGTPAVVSVSGSFADGGLSGFPSFTISNSPAISAAGAFSPSGQLSGTYSRPGNFAPPRTAIPVVVKEDWTLLAASRDSLTGTLTLTITPSGNLCGQAQTTACTGNVTVKRTILTAR